MYSLIRSIIKKMQKWERVNLSYSHTSKPNQIHCMRDDPKLLDIHQFNSNVFSVSYNRYIHHAAKKKRMHHERLTLRLIFLAGSQWRREPTAGIALAAAARGAKQQQAVEEA
jgi:hypothetical protein